MGAGVSVVALHQDNYYNADVCRRRTISGSVTPAPGAQERNGEAKDAAQQTPACLKRKRKQLHVLKTEKGNRFGKQSSKEKVSSSSATLDQVSPGSHLKRSEKFWVKTVKRGITSSGR